MEVGIMHPGIGVAAIIVKDGKVLLGRRGHKSSHARGVWGFTGGKLEFGESFEKCAIRETREEAGIEITNLRVVGVTNDIHFEDRQHYVSIFMLADWVSGLPQTKEAGKVGEWNWFSWDNLPQPLFLPIENLINQGFDFDHELQRGNQRNLQPVR